MASITNAVGPAADDNNGAGISSARYYSRRDMDLKRNGVTTGRIKRTELAAVG